MIDEAERPIAVIHKNFREEVRIGLGEFNGHQLVSLRVYTDNSKVDHRLPTKAGISLQVAKLPALIEGLQQALDEARRRGLVP